MSVTHNNIFCQQANDVLRQLKEGNFRFVNNLRTSHDLLKQVDATKDGQQPPAVILSCMDSRTSVELIFDQGLGALFSIRIAGNVISDSILGSLEYATAFAGSSLIVVLGHTGCGAIKGACDDVKSGCLTSVINKIKPAIESEKTFTENRNSGNADFVNEVGRLNVLHSVSRIISESETIHTLIKEGKAGIVPAMYNVATGWVNFYDMDMKNTMRIKDTVDRMAEVQ